MILFSSTVRYMDPARLRRLGRLQNPNVYLALDAGINLYEYIHATELIARLLHTG